MNTARLARLATALATAALLTACGTTVVNPVTGQAERTVMDEQAEISEGRQAHKQVLAQYGAYGNAQLQGYVSTLGNRLAAQSHRSGLPWTFTVLDSPEVNAFALPGGYVYVTRGIMAYLDSEAELAGVIGHEIGHVTARHGAQRATRQQSAGFGVLAATLLGATLEAVGLRGATDLASSAAQGLAAGYVARYSRDQELQADQLGAEYLVRNRFDPQNMVDVIGVLKNQERFAADQAQAEGRAAPEGGGWLASHPSNDQRLADIRATAARLAAANPGGFVDDGRARYLQALQGLTFGDGREQGVVRGRQFFHEPLGIALTAPAGWRVINGSEAIVLANDEGDVGLVVTLVPEKAGSNPEEIVRKLYNPSELRLERKSVNGLALTQFSGSRKAANGQTVPLSAAIVTGPQNHFYLLRTAAKDSAALQRQQARLAEAAGSFRPLSAADRAQARPWQIRLVPMPAGGFAELARQSPLGASAEAQLRLINSVYGDTQRQPAPGTLVKQVVATP